MTSVLIIDDHPIVLQGCRRMLEDAGVKTVLEARDVTSGYRLYRRHHPDVVIVDLAMQGGGLGGLDVIRRMRSHEPRTRILVFSMYSDPIVAARALEAGATGYVLKDTSSDELMKAFDQVRTGTPYLSNDLAMQVALVRTGVRTNPLADLTPRELQTLSLLAEGKPYGRIAEELNVSYALGAGAEVRLAAIGLARSNTFTWTSVRFRPPRACQRIRRRLESTSIPASRTISCAWASITNSIRTKSGPTSSKSVARK
jgi:two-component system invasion response regulator UvrY